MTRSTHQVAAFSAGLGALVLIQSLVVGSPAGEALAPATQRAAELLGVSPGVTFPWPVATVYVLSALLGGIAPDLDKPDRLWARLLSDAVLGGHRHLSHSLLGLGLAAGIAWGALSLVAPLLSFPFGLLWMGFVAGYFSHLVMDSLTFDGVPWLYPWRVYLGLPPTKRARIRTGSWAEQLLVMPALLTFVGWLGYRHGSLLASLWW